uniref:N-alpha-acetyltransferase 40 n=1 Tax=Peronospora matthiolae TaxID=2874970 RepID=A0AAV1URI9_9STRA
MPVTVPVHPTLVAANTVSDVTADFPTFIYFTRTEISVSICGSQSKDLSEVTREGIAALFEKNMELLYQASNWGYESRAKREELFADEARYLLVYDESIQALHPLKPLVGFVHFRFLDDDGALVLYLYEVQLAAKVQRQGLGKFLMTLLLLVAKKHGMELLVLTVFKRNTGAMRFYTERMGFEIDETSPSACGDDSQDYEILSKSVVKKK